MKNQLPYLNTSICASFQELHQWLKNHNVTKDNFDAAVKEFWLDKLKKEFKLIKNYEESLLDFSESEPLPKPHLISLSKALIDKLSYPKENYLEEADKLVIYFDDVDAESLQNEVELLLKKSEFKPLNENISIYCKSALNNQSALVILYPH